MKVWQKILKDHDCDMTIIDDNTAIIHNKCCTIKENADNTKDFIYHDETIKREKDGYTITNGDLNTVEECDSIYEYLGY